MQRAAKDIADIRTKYGLPMSVPLILPVLRMLRLSMNPAKTCRSTWIELASLPQSGIRFHFLIFYIIVFSEEDFPDNLCFIFATLTRK